LCITDEVMSSGDEAAAAYSPEKGASAPTAATGPTPPDMPRRSQTFPRQTKPEPDSPFITTKPPRDPSSHSLDASEMTDNDDGDAGRASVDMDEMPIELVSLTDRYYGPIFSPSEPRGPFANNT
jgi:hypothetical protein